MPDCDIPEENRPGPNHHVVFEGRMTLDLLIRRPPKGDAMIEGAIVPNFRRLPNHDSRAVINEEVPPDRAAGMNFDSRSPFSDHHQPFRKELKMVLPKEARHMVV